MVIRIALTVHQPYATLLVLDVKDIENRGRALPSTRTGRMLWIHAGRTIRPVEADPFAWEQAAALGWGVEEIQADAGRILGWVIPWGSHHADECHTEMPVGTGPLVKDRYCSRWAHPDAHHWPVSDGHRIDDPPACRGQQGLWRIPEEIDT